MRYIPVSCIKEGMVLARPIFGPNFGVLLGEGLTITGLHIQRINKLGYAGIYIEDPMTAEIQIRDIIPDKLRLDTIREAKAMWQQAEQRMRARGAKAVRAKKNNIIMPVIEALIDNPKRLVELIDLKPEEDYLYFHTGNVVILSLLIGVELGLSGTQLYELGLSALLHDVGNIFVPKALLEKPGKLSDAEFETIKRHTQLGFDYLKDNFEISIEGCMGALQHHENYDGSGYPTGLKRDRISIFGRIIAVTDVYDALTSRRPFRNMLYPTAAMDYLQSKSGTMFDPEIIEVFRRVVPLYPLSFIVELDSGQRGVVVENFVGYPDRPRIRLLDTRYPEYIDLCNDRTFKDSHVTQIIGM